MPRVKLTGADLKEHLDAKRREARAAVEEAAASSAAEYEKTARLRALRIAAAAAKEVPAKPRRRRVNPKSQAGRGVDA